MAPTGFKTIIAGGGVAGLALGVMLERAGIDFLILEAEREVRPLGAVLLIGPAVLRVFEQLGLLDDMIRNSNVMTGVTLLDHKLNTICRIGTDYSRERYGYDNITIARPKLYDILLSRIPAYKIHFGKRVQSTSQTSEGVKIRCVDGTTYNGDVLVAADGGSSSIRRAIYDELRRRNKKVQHPADYSLPKMDQRCIVGVSEPLPTSKYPVLASKNCELMLIMPKAANCTIWFVPMAERRFGWGITSPLPSAEATGNLKSKSARDLDIEHDTPGSPSSIHGMTRSFSAMSDTSYSPPSTTSSSSGHHIGDYDYSYSSSSIANAGAPDMSDCYTLNNNNSGSHINISSTNNNTLSSNAINLSSSSSSNNNNNNNNNNSSSTNVNSVIAGSNYYPPNAIRKRQSFGRLSKHSTASTVSQTKSLTYSTVIQSDDASLTLKELPRDRVWGKLEEKYTVEEAIREHPSPYGGTFGDIIDATSRKMISMVVVEEKFYHTWHLGRTVLLGDACHKLLPSSGHATTQGILDAISLASLLAELPSNEPGDIEALFQVHYQRRGPSAKAAVFVSQQQAQMLFNRKLSGKIMRKMASNWLSDWFKVKLIDRLFESRPLLPYLKAVPDRGTFAAKDKNLPLVQDKRFEMARRKSVSSAYLNGSTSSCNVQGSSTGGFEMEFGPSLSPHYNATSSTSMPSIALPPVVPPGLPVTRPISSMAEMEESLKMSARVAAAEAENEYDTVAGHGNHWHRYHE